MRCLTLADAMQNLGAECMFVSRDHVGNLHQVVRERGYSLISLGGTDCISIETPFLPYANWIGVDSKRDAIETREKLAGMNMDLLVVDHYGLGASWELCMLPYVGQIMVIDDLANRHHISDVLLDQNLGKNKFDYETLVPASCDLKLGPHYALLRPEFAALQSKSLSRREKGHLHKLLITMGGVDLHNTTGAVLEALDACGQSFDLEVTVVMGSTAPWQDQVIEQARSLSFHTEVLVNVHGMGELMCNADLAIGGAGSTSWERCCLGLPTLQIVLAENQRPIAQALCHAGAAHLLDCSALTANLGAVMDKLKQDPMNLLRMSSAASELVDGLGAQRVALYLHKGI